MAEEVVLMKGNEAIAHAAIRIGVDGYFGYPITPQSEILETLAEEKPWETTGMVVLQAESEVAAINMVYGGAASGKMVMTSSSSPGVSLKQEGISYIAGAELPCLIVNVMRGGPGLGTIQPSQADYFQTVKGGGHGDYRLIALAPASVQEMADFVGIAFDLAFKYRNPAIILADGVIGQMMEKVVLPEQRTRLTDEEVIARCPWATTGRTHHRTPNIITSLELDPAEMEKRNIHLQKKICRNRRKRSTFRRTSLRRCRIFDRSFRFLCPHCPKSNGNGSGRRHQSWFAPSYYPMAVPVESYCSTRRTGKRYPHCRIERRTNGRRCPSGCKM